MTPNFLIEAFGQHSPGSELASIDSEEEKDGLFHRVFEARAELMGWSTGWAAHRSPLLWNIYDAGLTHSTDASLIGWVYGELSSLVDPAGVMTARGDLPEMSEAEARELLAMVPGETNAGWAAIPVPPGYGETAVGLPMVLPPLLQCFDDALHRLGAAEVSGFQATWYGAHLGSSGRFSARHLASGVGWFDIPAQAGADALIAFDSGFLGGHTEAELVAGIRRWRTGAFEFGPPVAVPGEHMVRVAANSRGADTIPQSSGIGVPVRLPEWTGGAAGWALASVDFAARNLAPDVGDFAVRITRVP